jgi:hypothetical protein
MVAQDIRTSARRRNDPPFGLISGAETVIDGVALGVGVAVGVGVGLGVEVGLGVGVGVGVDVPESTLRIPFPLRDCPSGLVTLIVQAPPGAEVVFRSSVTCVGSM